MSINVNTSVRKNLDNILFINNVLKNAYFLLSFTILFSALVSYISIILNIKYIGFIPSIILYFVFYFLIHRFKNGIYGIFFVFLFTGFCGYIVTPLLLYLIKTPNGIYTICLSLGITGLLFFSLSFYVLFTKKNFSFLNGFLFVGVMFALFLLMLMYFFPLSILNLIICSIIIIISSAYILYTTSNVINGGEYNYILVTIDLYLSIFNIFISFLNIFSDDK